VNYHVIYQIFNKIKREVYDLKHTYIYILKKKKEVSFVSKSKSDRSVRRRSKTILMTVSYIDV